MLIIFLLGFFLPELYLIIILLYKVTETDNKKQPS